MVERRTGCADKPGRFVDNEDAHILVLCAQMSHVVLATTCVRVVGYVDYGRETSPRASTFHRVSSGFLMNSGDSCQGTPQP